MSLYVTFRFVELIRMAAGKFACICKTFFAVIQVRKKYSVIHRNGNLDVRYFSLPRDYGH